MHYKVIVGNSVPSLQNEVQIHLDDGWELRGGVSVAVQALVGQESGPIYLFAQALVKLDKDRKRLSAVWGRGRG